MRGRFWLLDLILTSFCMTDPENIIHMMRTRTENYYEAHRLCCSEAITYVFNKGLKGGLEENAALRIGSGFCGGMGGGDGVCGALSGAMAMLGIFLGPGQEGGLSKKQLRAAAKKLHDRFKETLSSTSCPDLTKEYQDNKRARLKNCQSITGTGATILAEILLEHRPELAARADRDFLAAHDSKIGVLLQKIPSLF